jgi:hypothetical protein
MTDRVFDQSGIDRSRINIAEDYQLSFWTQQFGVTVEQLAIAVKKVGSSADAVRRLLLR